MKRFLTAAVCLLLAALGAYYAIFHAGVYLDFGRDETVDVPFRSFGTEYQRETENGYETIVLRGVDVSSSMPGNYATAYAPNEEDYLRWFEAIGAMGANAVRVVNIMDDDFYNALYAYNTGREEPLYLLQGISVSDAAGNGSQDAYSSDFLGSLLENGKDLVDVIHGRKNLIPSDLQGSGSYRRDVSPWVVGILVGNEWYPDTVAYTDHSVTHTGDYAGTYFQTAEDATAFEAMLAQVMDTIVSYETKKYHVQRPVGFISDPSCDFLEYEEVYAKQLGKYAYLDPEHVIPTAAMEAGRFAAYRLYDFCEDFTQYLSEGQRAQLGVLLQDLDMAQVYGGYLELMARYHSMPVLAAGYGFSSARGASKIGEEPLTEQEQGLRLAQVSEALEQDGWTGGFISTWQDVWERRSWNTAFAAVPTQNYLWHDVQTDGQNYGLMAFEPGEEPVCVLDGDPAEWGQEDLVLEQDGMQVFARYDAEGLYLMADGLRSGEQIYLPIDISPDLGSNTSTTPELSFARKADFLLCLDGETNSRLLVWERYDAMRENFLYEAEGEDPFVEFPGLDSTEFVPIYMALENDLLLDDISPENRILQRLGKWETGRLVSGNGDPESQDYNSLADICYGDGCVELRLPWLLLNVGDPSKMAVHKDYYVNYGVEFESVKELWIGIARDAGTEEIPMAAFSLKGWGTKISYRERLKQSYTVMQELWGGDGNNASDG